MNHIEKWEERSIITANLLNPAFCGEVLLNTINSYNDNDEGIKFPFSLVYLVLPFVLHKKTRMLMPRTTRSHFYNWIQENEFLFIDFAERTKELLPFSKETIIFLLQNNVINITDNGCIEIISKPQKTKEELSDIFNKAKLLGKLFYLTGNEDTIYMFLKIRP